MSSHHHEPHPPVPALTVRTRAIGLDTDLLGLIPTPAAHVWLRRGEGMVGWGTAARIDLTGPDRGEQAAAWWRSLTGAADITDPIRSAGAGLICFGTFTFDDYSAEPSTLIVPRVIAGRRRGQAWLTAIGPELPETPTPVADHGAVSERPGTHSARQWPGVVRRGIDHIATGALDKVVLARDIWIDAEAPIDPRLITRRLADQYPTCWTFSLDGLIGATPELLVRTAHRLVTSRVLAGTIRRTDDDTANLARAAALARSSKDLEEHHYAVESVASVLATLTDELNIPDDPSVLHLANVMHLATDITGVLLAGPTSLDVAMALHPTAAVAGTPTDAARALLRQLEGADRGRYCGPVGWMNAAGDGEWAIALRCAQLSANRRHARCLAGGGIVGASVPAEELAETEAKLAPMRQALQGQLGPSVGQGQSTDQRPKSSSK